VEGLNDRPHRSCSDHLSLNG